MNSSALRNTSSSLQSLQADDVFVESDYLTPVPKTGSKKNKAKYYNLTSLSMDEKMQVSFSVM